MERGLGHFGNNSASSENSSVLERLGQRTDQSSHSLLSGDKPAMFVHYTIAEDRCGTQDDVMSGILSRLARRQRTPTYNTEPGPLESGQEGHCGHRFSLDDKFTEPAHEDQQYRYVIDQEGLSRQLVMAAGIRPGMVTSVMQHGSRMIPQQIQKIEDPVQRQRWEMGLNGPVLADGPQVISPSAGRSLTTSSRTALPLLSTSSSHRPKQVQSARFHNLSLPDNYVLSARAGISSSDSAETPSDEVVQSMIGPLSPQNLEELQAAFRAIEQRRNSSRDWMRYDTKPPMTMPRSSQQPNIHMTEDDWEFYKLEIGDLFHDNTVSDVRRIMLERHSIYASLAQYRSHLSKWSLRINPNRRFG